MIIVLHSYFYQVSVYLSPELSITQWLPLIFSFMGPTLESAIFVLSVFLE